VEDVAVSSTPHTKFGLKLRYQYMESSPVRLLYIMALLFEFHRRIGRSRTDHTIDLARARTTLGLAMPD
jgi:hypothetical protein